MELIALGILGEIGLSEVGLFADKSLQVHSICDGGGNDQGGEVDDI